MKHYIKVDNFAFDPVKGKLNIKLYFDIAINNGIYKDLQFKTFSIDTEKTFVCSTEPSVNSTKILASNANYGAANIDESYEFFDDGLWVQSGRRIWNIELDLNDIHLNGVLATLSAEDLKNTLLFLFVEVAGDYYDVQSTSWLAKQPKMVMMSLYDPRALFELIYGDLANVDMTCCSTVDNFAANNIIFLHGLESSLCMERWKDAIKFWNLIHNKTLRNSNSCGCRK